VTTARRLKRAELAIETLRTRHVADGFQLDEAGAARTLSYLRDCATGRWDWRHDEVEEAQQAQPHQRHDAARGNRSTAAVAAVGIYTSGAGITPATVSSSASISSRSRTSFNALDTLIWNRLVPVNARRKFLWSLSFNSIALGCLTLFMAARGAAFGAPLTGGVSVIGVAITAKCRLAHHEPRRNGPPLKAVVTGRDQIAKTVHRKSPTSSKRQGRCSGRRPPF
jgi:hypothetical protein